MPFLLNVILDWCFSLCNPCLKGCFDWYSEIFAGLSWNVRLINTWKEWFLLLHLCRKYLVTIGATVFHLVQSKVFINHCLTFWISCRISRSVRGSCNLLVDISHKIMKKNHEFVFYDNHAGKYTYATCSIYACIYTHTQYMHACVHMCTCICAYTHARMYVLIRFVY